MTSFPTQWTLFLCWITTIEMIMFTVVMVDESQLNTALDVGFNKSFEEYYINQRAWDMVQTKVKQNPSKKMKMLYFSSK